MGRYAGWRGNRTGTDGVWLKAHCLTHSVYSDTESKKDKDQQHKVWLLVHYLFRER